MLQLDESFDDLLATFGYSIVVCTLLVSFSKFFDALCCTVVPLCIVLAFFIYKWYNDQITFKLCGISSEISADAKTLRTNSEKWREAVHLVKQNKVKKKEKNRNKRNTTSTTKTTDANTKTRTKHKEKCINTKRFSDPTFSSTERSLAGVNGKGVEQHAPGRASKSLHDIPIVEKPSQKHYEQYLSKKKRGKGMRKGHSVEDALYMFIPYEAIYRHPSRLHHKQDTI